MAKCRHETMYAFEDSTVLLAEWPEVSTPSRADCLATIRMDGLAGTGTLSSGSQVCGTTVEGRPFLIQSQRIDSGDVMYAEVTMWNP